MHKTLADYRPLVSVMIPFHNAADTLDRCLLSVVALTYRPIDVIIVDDASSDNGSRIVEGLMNRYASEGLRIRLFRHEVNRGVAAARACALAHAEGEYITAVDADDYIDPDAVDAYVAATDEGRADIVAGGVFYEYPRKSVPVLFRPGERLTLEEASIDSLHFLLTNKLLRTSMLREMRPFTPGQDCWEDLGAVSRMLASGARTVVLEGAWYHYMQSTAGSLTKSDPDRILRQHIAVARSLEEWMTARGVADSYASFLTYLKFIAKVKWLRNPSEFRRHPVRRLRGWRDTFPEVNGHIMKLKHVRLRHRLLFFMAGQAARLL